MADGKAVHRAKGSSEHSARLDGRRSLVNTGAPLSGGYFTTSDSRTGGRPLDVLMERRMRWKSHVRCGGRRRGDHRPKGRHRRLAVDPTPADGVSDRLRDRSGRARLGPRAYDPNVAEAFAASNDRLGAKAVACRDGFGRMLGVIRAGSLVRTYPVHAGRSVVLAEGPATCRAP